jgi:hypothetical protein
LALDEVPVVVLDHLTPKQKKAYILADNKLALNAGWDLDLLREELVGLQIVDFDLSLMGWSPDELEGLLPEPDFDEADGDSQGQLDEMDDKEISCRCPECGHAFTQKA